MEGDIGRLIDTLETKGFLSDKMESIFFETLGLLGTLIFRLFCFSGDETMTVWLVLKPLTVS